jgi:hypothetical protein
MHQTMRDTLEKSLSGELDVAGRKHLRECEECSAEFAAMQSQAQALRELRAPSEFEPRPGFYARVMERIEAEGASIWDLFFESIIGRRIAIASSVLAVLLGVYLFTAERSDESAIADQQPTTISMPAEFANELEPLPQVQSVGLGSSYATPDQDAVLQNLVTYREQ